MKQNVIIKRVVETAFGSPHSYVKFQAICPETGEIIDNYEYRCNAWEVHSSEKNIKKLQFTEQLELKGFNVINK